MQEELRFTVHELATWMSGFNTKFLLCGITVNSSYFREFGQPLRMANPTLFPNEILGDNIIAGGFSSSSLQGLSDFQTQQKAGLLCRVQVRVIRAL